MSLSKSPQRVVFTLVRLVSVVVFVGCMLCSCASQRGGAGSDRLLRSEAKRFLEGAPELVEIHRPEPEEWELPNGLRVLFLRDEEIPIVSGTLFLPGGTLSDGTKATGLVSAMGSLMRVGGTEELSPEELDERLLELAAAVSSGYGREYGTVSFNALSGDFEEVLELFADVVRRPRFDPTRVSLFQVQTLDAIRRRKDDPVSVARTTASTLMYGDSVYGGVLRSEDVKWITRDELFRRHKKFVRPDGATFVVTGKIDRERVADGIAQAFADWEPRGGLLQRTAKLPRPSAPGIYLIEGDFTQANIYAIQPGPRRHTEDRYGIRLLNNILGDGLDSRLTKSVRADLGLAYTIYGVISPNVEKGENLLFIQTKSESVDEALLKAIEELNSIQATPPGEAELETMQLAAQNSFVFRFSSPSQILERIVILEMLEYPEDYDERYLERIFEVKPADVQAVAERWWKDEAFRIVIVGDSEALQEIRKAVKSSPSLRGYPVRELTFDEVPKGVL
ncbi:insulinase family protein [bacterium]|nr:insulinase family protein [bacterium]